MNPLGDLSYRHRGVHLENGEYLPVDLVHKLSVEFYSLHAGFGRTLGDYFLDCGV
jgi:hypothetical protein